MHTLGLRFNKDTIEKVMFTLTFGVMEITGVVLLFCGLFNIPIC